MKKTSTHRRLKHRVRERRKVYKKFLLHPITIFLLLCIGVLFANLALKSSALSVSATAKVAAPLPKSAVHITIVAPAGRPALQKAVSNNDTAQNSLHTNARTIILSGDCPKDSHIEFYRNKLFAGVVPCIGDPAFSITLDLFDGLNVIEAHVFNVTNDEGPVSQLFYITYDAPSPPASTPPSLSEFILSSDFEYLGFLTGQQGSWNIKIRGGEPPYNFSVNWGDGLSSSYVRADAASFPIEHTYKKPSGHAGYIISIQSTDANGKVATLNLMTIVSRPSSYQASQIHLANTVRHPSFLARLTHWLRLGWPIYGVVFLMVVSFLMGEWEEYKKLAARLRRRKR